METERKIVAILGRLKTRWFPTADDKLWKEWVDFKQKTIKDLMPLLEQDVREAFKKRVVFLLLVPFVQWVPFYWLKKADGIDSGGVGKFYHNTDFLKKLSPSLLRYAAELVRYFYSKLKPLHCENPRTIVAGGGGVTLYMSAPSKYHDALHFYNRCILELLALLPKDEAGRLFELFSLRDVSTFWNMDDASGYDPFRTLLGRKDIDEEWKRKADAAVRKIVLAEHQGEARPRKDWEKALSCYADAITCGLHNELPYSLELFVDQLTFLLSNGFAGEDRLISPWDVARILKLLKGDHYKELRHTLSRFVVFNNGEKYPVYNEETGEAARMMLEEFGGSDPDLKAYLETALEESRRRDEENTQQQALARQKEEEILAAMR